jgi:colanic acid/amylovoran biosynthesis glycosyltransferase
MPEDPVQRPSSPLKIPNEEADGGLRIAFFVASFPELSETFITRQVVGLLDRGHDVRIFAYEKPSAGATHDLVDRRALQQRVTVLEPGVASPARGSSARPGSSGALLRCARATHARASGGWMPLVRDVEMLTRLGPFDVVHCHFGNVGLRYAVAACVWRAPLVVSFYGYDASSYPRERGADVYAPLFSQARAVVSLSDHMDARLRALGCPASLLRRVPLSVDPNASEEPRPERDPGRVRLLTVARLVEKKGIEHALRAVALVKDELPTLRYDVIGEGPLRPTLEALASTLGISERVRFLGARTEGEVRGAMREANLFLLPSVTASDGDEEGTPTVLLEAAWARLPVVSTRHAGIPEIVRDGETGVLVAERDAEALASALRALVLAPDRWDVLGDAGRERVASAHTIPIVAERLEGIYEELLSPSTRRRRAGAGARR